MRILIVEDEVELAGTMARILSESGINVEIAHNGVDGFALAQVESFDVILLDVLLPQKTGWEICRDLRLAKVNTPIMMLTAMDAVEDRVKGLTLGADDYLPKPFHATELVARVRALVRREQVNRGDLIEIGDLTVERSTRQVTRAGRKIELTPREFDLLYLLAANEGRVMSREIIEQRAWGDEVYSNMVEVYVSSLRKKLELASERKLIFTAHGVGYVLKTDVATP
jgi:DNA-binding response OmpR family regulator